MNVITYNLLRKHIVIRLINTYLREKQLFKIETVQITDRITEVWFNHVGLKLNNFVKNNV